MTLLYKTNMRHIYASTVWTFIKLFLLYAQIEEYQIILNIRCRPIAFTWYKASLKNKKGSATSLPASFSVWFWNKKISNVIFYEPTKLHCLIAFLLGLKIMTQFAQGYKFPLKKTYPHLKSYFPPEMTLLKSQQNFQSRLKWNFLFTPISNILKRFSRWLESS